MGAALLLFAALIMLIESQVNTKVVGEAVNGAESVGNFASTW